MIANSLAHQEQDPWAGACHNSPAAGWNIMTPIAERKVGSKPMPDNITSLSNSHLPENLYERDYYTWAFGQARALEERRADALDWKNLADEVRELAGSVARSLQVGPNAKYRRHCVCVCRERSSR